MRFYSWHIWDEPFVIHKWTTLSIHLTFYLYIDTLSSIFLLCRLFLSIVHRLIHVWLLITLLFSMFPSSRFLASCFSSLFSGGFHLQLLLLKSFRPNLPTSSLLFLPHRLDLFFFMSFTFHCCMDGTNGSCQLITCEGIYCDLVFTPATAFNQNRCFTAVWQAQVNQMWLIKDGDLSVLLVRCSGLSRHC